MLNTQVLFGVVVVPAVIGLTQVAKQVGVPSRFAPLVAVFFGVLAGLAQLYAVSVPWIQAVVIGVALGLSAVGLYSGVTTFLPTTTTEPALPAPTPIVPATTTTTTVQKP